MKKVIKTQKKKLKSFNSKFKEECGVFGISNAKDASALTALGLHALQHRGQEGCGIVSFDGEKYYSEKRFGLVGDNFNKEKVLNNLKGNYAIGHNRYSTTGENTLRNIQPFFADTNAGGIGVAHNGNLTNSISLSSFAKPNQSDPKTRSGMVAVPPAVPSAVLWCLSQIMHVGLAPSFAMEPGSPLWHQPADVWREKCVVRSIQPHHSASLNWAQAWGR